MCVRFRCGRISGVTKRNQRLSPSARNRGPLRSWAGLAVLVIVNFITAPASAQNCTAENPQLAVAVLQRVLDACSSSDEVQALQMKYGHDVILDQASIAGKLAIPVLREFAALPKHNECTSSTFDAAARTALAKLGDESAYAVIKKQWVQHRGGPYPARIDFIGDDWALQTMVEFLIQHANDPSMIELHGPSDATFDGRDAILAQIKGIARRHVVPDLPNTDYSSSGIAQWKAWLVKYKGQHLSTPVYENVSDPYLQCLALRVEWEHPDAILDIATFGGPSAEAILKQFPAPKPGELMGARGLYRDVLRNENEDESRPNPDSVIQGNLQAALLRFGDRGTAFQVATELSSFAIYPGYFPLEAIRKLRFAGGKTAVGILVDGLGSSNRVSQDAQKNFDACVVTVTAANQPWKQLKEAAEKACVGSFSWAERRTSLILSALAEMVKNPPLPANVPPTTESSQKWKDWWAKNRDKAVFVIPPRASYDWH
jgi:hypothetical protein